MKKFNKYLSAMAVAAVVLAFAEDASAQRRFDDGLPYGYGNTLELQGGWAFSPYTVDGASSNAHGVATGANFSLRYSYFATRHWGFYTEFHGYGGYVESPGLFSVANRVDGGKYVYDDYGWSRATSVVPALSVGAVYRYDFNHWSLRPRLGVGVGQFNPGSSEYVRYDRNNQDGAPEFFRYCYESRDYDFIANSNYSYGRKACFVGTASLQLAYTLRRHFFFSAEAGLNVAAKRMDRVLYQYGSRPAYDPHTWTEAISEAHLEGTYYLDNYNVTKTAHNQTLFGSGYVKFGIGWNIGRNRNDNGWYYRR